MDRLKYPKYVIASSRPWNASLASRLADRIQGEFILISDPRELTVERLAQIDPKYVFFPHWSFIIDRQIHENFTCVIFHMTDLPFGRGGSPLQNLIQRGHADTVISALKCVSELDAGPIFSKVPLSLNGSAKEIFERADSVIEGMIISICETSPDPVPQSGEVVEFRRRTPIESQLPTNLSNEDIFDFIRMLDADGYPRAFLEFDGHRLEFFDAELESGDLTARVNFVKKGSSK